MIFTKEDRELLKSLCESIVEIQKTVEKLEKKVSGLTSVDDAKENRRRKKIEDSIKGLHKETTKSLKSIEGKMNTFLSDQARNDSYIMKQVHAITMKDPTGVCK